MKLFIIFFGQAFSLSWLGVGVHTPNNICKSEALDHVQRKLCERNNQYSMALAHAASTTVKGCKTAMAGHRWGCKSVTALPALKRDLKEATSESAFVHALGSAQLISSLYRLCQSGTIGECSNKDIKQFATEFTDVVSLQKRRKSQGVIEIHNSNIGRELAWKSTNRICKCHGQSGSCTQKTCWDTAPDSNTLTEKLSKKYDSAAMIKLGKSGIPPEMTKFIARDRLLYLQPRNDFCNDTHGRECNPDSTKSDNCKQLCCNRGYIQRLHTTVEDECKFIWPARIECTPKIQTHKKYLCR